MKTQHDNIPSKKVPPLGGEGDKQADRNYREGVKRTIDSGKIPQKAAEAAEALDDPEQRAEGEAAEREGKARSKGEDPKLWKQRS